MKFLYTKNYKIGIKKPIIYKIKYINICQGSWRQKTTRLPDECHMYRHPGRNLDKVYNALNKYHFPEKFYSMLNFFW